MTDRKRWNRAGALLSAMMLTIVLVATLTPAASTPTGDFWCVACGEYGGLDVLNNIVLFLPLGFAFAVATDRRWRSVLACVAVTVFVESMQIRIIPGRDASLSDLLANSFGGALGVELALWRSVLLRPRGRAASVLTMAAATGFALVTALTSVGLRTASIPRSLWIQWTPERASFDPFTGELLAFKLDSIDLPARFYPPVSLGVDRVLRSAEWHATVHIGTENLKPRRSVIARIAEEFTVLVSGDFRFRSPKIAIRGALSRSGEEPAERVRFTCSRQHDSLVATTDDREEVLRLTPSLGWLFLTPLNITVPSRYVLVGVLWLMALAFPAGYWMAFIGTSGAAAGARAGRGQRSHLLAMGVFAAALATGLVIVPSLAGTAPAAWWEWASSVAGVLAGSAGAHVGLRWQGRWAMRDRAPLLSA